MRTTAPRTRSTVKRSLVALAAIALLNLTVSCGQYRYVHANGVAAGQAGGGLSTSGTGGTGSTAGTGGTTTTGGSLGGGATGTGPSAGGSSSGGGSSFTSGGGSSSTGGGSSSTGGGSSAAQQPTGPGDRTGVTSTSITIGIHAPLTGAAPVKQTSFQTGKDLYWKYGNNGGPVKIFGRTVHVIFQDDHYNPSTAKQVCQQMAEQDHAFLLIGGAGTDQIVACAEYAASKNIPYVSAGVTKAPLAHLS